MTTKKSKKRTTKPQGTAAGTETLELSVAQVYERQLRQVLDDWAEKALEMLAEDIRTLDRPGGVLKIEPRTSDALRRTLSIFGADAVQGWVVLPPRPKPAEFRLPPPSETALERAAQVRRIEDSYTYTFDARRFVNEDRARAGLPPLPPPDDEDEASDE